MSRVSSFCRVAAVSVLALICAVAAPGCGSKVTQENFAQIKDGMIEADVIKILGAATSTETQTSPLGSATKDTWKDGDKSIVVGLLDGKVVGIEKTGF